MLIRSNTFQRLVSAVLAACLAFFCLGGALTTFADSAFADDAVTDSAIADSISAQPAELFEANCAACHANGGNIIRRGKTLKSKALARYGYDNSEAITALVNQGKGAMPAYADRLSETEISALAQYVLEQADSGW